MAHSTVFTIIDSPCINMTTFFEYTHILILPYCDNRYFVLLIWGVLAKVANKVPTDPQRFVCKVTLIVLCVSGGDTTCTRRTEEKLLITSCSIRLLIV